MNGVEDSEMLKFVDEAGARLDALPPAPSQSGLLDQVETLKGAIANKDPATKVAAIARRLSGEVLAAYPVALAPSAPPDPARGAILYAKRCAI